MSSFFDFLNPISNLFSTGYRVYQDQRNYNYQKQLQEELFNRDDTAMQRRMADYQAAGINPLMALGSSGAGVSSAGTNAGAVVDVGDVNPENQKAVRLQNSIFNLKRQQEEQSLTSLKFDNEKKELENEILRKQVEEMGTLGFYPYSALGKWTIDANSILGGFLKNITRSDNPISLLDPLGVFQSIFGGRSDSVAHQSLEEAIEKSNQVVDSVKDKVSKKVNDFKVDNPVADLKNLSKNNQVHKSLVSNLNNAFSEYGLHFYNEKGKFRVENFNSRPPVQVVFDTYQEALKYARYAVGFDF